MTAAEADGPRLHGVPIKVGRRVPLLQIKQLLDAADIDKLRLPRWDGPFTVTVCLSNNAYRDTRASPCRARLG